MIVSRSCWTCLAALFGCECATLAQAPSISDGWRHIAVNSPPKRYLHSLAFDSLRGESVCTFGAFGDGSDRRSDTWEWNGVRWSLRSTTGPIMRFSHSTAFDSTRGATVLFGGWQSDCFNCGVFSAATWEWDGEKWLMRRQGWTLEPDNPPQRAYPGMVFNSMHGVTLMHGGVAEDPRCCTFFVNDTWAWDGEEWRKIEVPSPPPRAGHKMAYDSRRGVTVLFGGIRDNNTLFGDTWEFDGQAWTQVANFGPAPRAWHDMVYHEVRGTVILFGGSDTIFEPTVVHGDTWEWNGSNWTPIDLPISPEPRFGHAMAYDSHRDVVVLFGGANATPQFQFDDTWELTLPAPCYPDCDTKTGPGILDFFDFLCFGNRFETNDPYTCDCDTSTGPGVCDILDFLCFGNAFSAGCP